MKFKKLFSAAFLVGLLSFYGVSLSFAYDISPQNPVKGDILKLTGSCTSGDVPITLKFSREVGVENGRYEYDVGTIQIPTKSTLSIRAENVKDLTIGVKMLIWFTVTREGVNGVATYSRSISGKYRIKVFGNALDGATTVRLIFTAKTNIKCENGNLEYTYDSQYLPTGEYSITVNGETKTIMLLQERPPPPPQLPPPAAPAGKVEELRTVYLVANEIDYSLSKDLLDKLEQQYDLTIERTTNPSSCTLILGGPDAYNGTGEIVRKYLDMNEQNSIRAHGSKRIIGRGNVVIVAGSDRYMTRKAFEDRFGDVQSRLISCLDSTSS